MRAPKARLEGEWEASLQIVQPPGSVCSLPDIPAGPKELQSRALSYSLAMAKDIMRIARENGFAAVTDYSDQSLIRLGSTDYLVPVPDDVDEWARAETAVTHAIEHSRHSRKTTRN